MPKLLRRLRWWVAAASCVLVVAALGVVWVVRTSDDPGPLVLDGGISLAINRAHLGDVEGFAFPQMHNAGSAPVTIESLSIDKVPAGVEVVGYRLLSKADIGYYMLGSFPVTQKGPDGYDRYRDHLPDHPVIEPGGSSDYFGVVYLRVERHTLDSASGCRVTYRVDGVSRGTAPSPCTFYFDDDAV